VITGDSNRARERLSKLALSLVLPRHQADALDEPTIAVWDSSALHEGFGVFDVRIRQNYAFLRVGHCRCDDELFGAAVDYENDFFCFAHASLRVKRF